MTARPIHPLARLAFTLGGDFVSTLVFALVFARSHDLAWSLGLALASGVGGIAWTRARGRSVDALQWLSLALVVVFGGASLMTCDARLVMIKPTIIYLAVAAVMLKPGWMRRYLPEKALQHGAAITDRFGYVWSAAMASLAAANLALAWHGDVRLWGAFLASAPLALKLGLGVVQYVVTRATVIAAVRRNPPTTAALAA